MTLLGSIVSGRQTNIYLKQNGHSYVPGTKKSPTCPEVTDKALRRIENSYFPPHRMCVFEV